LVEDAIAFYSSRLGIALQTQPQVVLSILPDVQPRASQADVSRNSVIYARLYGQGWYQDGKFSTSAIETLAHETFHLWNGALYQQSGERFEPWLSEGAARYMSHLYLTRNSPTGDLKELLASAAKNANSCMRLLQDRSISDMTGGEAPYSCGYFLNFLIDVHARESGSDIYQF
ncbi:MAG: hypothetical protein LBE21_03870, partial [Pseudomonadales bacterium]|nr:hypothetical protein [Pseudomonadales bacterium]